MLYKLYWERPDEGHIYDEKYIIAIVEDQVIQSGEQLCRCLTYCILKRKEKVRFIL